MDQPNGRRRWEGAVDEDGFRSWSIIFRVQWFPDSGTGADYAGPNAALHAEGLPPVGAPYEPPDDLPDAVAYRRQPTRVTPVEEDGQRTAAFDLTLLFSNKPDPGRCKTASVDNPLLVPAQVSITYAAFKEEATHDRFGQAVAYSSHEVIRGPNSEFDRRRLVIKIVMNKSDEDFSPALLDAMQDTLNDVPVYGFARRRLKLTGSAEREFYGDCLAYWKVSLELESNGPRGWDRDVRDQSRKCIRGHWHPKVPAWVLERQQRGCEDEGELPNEFNPAHFMAARDRSGEPCTVVLDGHGRPYNPDPFAYTFRGTEAESQDEADSVRAAKLGPYAGEAAASAACCIFETHAGTGTSPRLPGEQPRQVYVYVGLEPSVILGDPVEDPRNWVILTDQLSPVAHWTDGVYYTRGSLAFLSPFNFIAAAANENQVPGADGTEDTWVELSLGLNDKGTWDENTIYRVGDYVVLGVPAGAPATGTGTAGGPQWWCISGVGDLAPGVRHVEYYGESHFQDLGLPATL